MDAQPRIAVPDDGNRGRIVWLCAAFVFVPLLFASSEGFLAALRFIGLAAALFLGWPFLTRCDGVSSLPGKVILGGILAAHLCAAIGGFLGGVPPARVLADAAAGITAIAGIFAAAAAFLSAGSGNKTADPIFRVASLFALVSLAAYFFPLQRLIALGDQANFYEPTRLASFWPTRLLTQPFGQIAWEHANHAGLLFSLMVILGLERCARDGPIRNGWLPVALAAVCLFLTGSRSSWLALVACLPFVLFRRPLRFLLATALTLTVAVALGLAALEMKIVLLRDPPPVSGSAATPPPSPAPDLHTSGLVQRGSSGRLEFYPLLWAELDGHRWFGKGLAATGKPVGKLNHEHSVFLASLRGGGILGLIAHLGIVAASGFLALRLYRRGVRWPLLLLGGVLANCLFDRSNLLRLGGGHAFLLHWTAVAVPLFLATRKQNTRAVAGPGVL